MAGIVEYTAVKNWTDDAPWTDTKMDAFVDQLQDYINDTLLVGIPNVNTQLGVLPTTTTTTNDSVKLTSEDGTALSSSGPILGVTLPSHSQLGRRVDFTLTADITLKISGAHWGYGTTGNVTGMVLRGGLINDGGATPALALMLVGRETVKDTVCFTTATSVNASERVLVSRAIASGTWPFTELFHVFVDFNDTGDIYTVQSGIGSVVIGKSADGIFQPWNPTFTGFSVNPTVSVARWCQTGLLITQELQLGGGTSNNAAFTATAAVKALSVLKTVCPVVDNGVGVVGAVTTSAAGTTMTFHDDANGSTFTAAGTKFAHCTINFEAYTG